MSEHPNSHEQKVLVRQDPRIEADIEIRRIEAKSNAKEVASKAIGRTAIPWIALLVIIGVVSSAFLPTESLPAVIGLVSTAVMALIGLLTGITGTSDKPEKPEIQIITDLVKRLDSKEPMKVTVEKDRVTVTKGEDVITTKKDAPDAQ
jgi:hypothetical protein